MNREHVLCVDDTSFVLNALHRLLSENYAVTCASDARQALALLAQRPDISIVLADYTMPDMDGLTFLQETRALAPGAVRILMTAWPDVRAIEQAIADGVILRCLSKPFGVEEVNTALGEAVEHLRTHGRS
jgi:DNA-binding NtrC family response regulator